jgi:hypothetical protein
MRSHSRGAMRPSCARRFPPNRGSRECRGARCTRGLVCKAVRKNAHEHTGSAETLRHSPRNGFTTYAVLSPATNSSCHRHRRIDGSAKPGWACENLRRFDTSNGCQNHTVLPYATASFVCRAVRSLTAEPPCDLVRARRCRVHRISSQRKRRSGYAPRWGTRRREF